MFYKITSNRNVGLEKVCVYNKGCNFKCLGCAYKTTAAEIDQSAFDAPIETAKIKDALLAMNPKRVHFLGGEPTINSELGVVAEFAHEELGATTEIGHSNGSGKIPSFIDETSISIKAFDENLHYQYTGVSNKKVLANFKDAYDRGITLRASTVLIPGMVTAEEVERIAHFVAEIDSNIPFHITAYIPVPGVSLRAPKINEIQEAVVASNKHLKHVSSTLLSATEFARFKKTNPLYISEQVELKSLPASH